MTLRELFNILEDLEQKGVNMGAKVLVDVEARDFDYHMAEIEYGFFECDEDTGLGDMFIINIG